MSTVKKLASLTQMILIASEETKPLYIAEYERSYAALLIEEGMEESEAREKAKWNKWV